jgi:hypothetical protein
MPDTQQGAGVNNRNSWHAAIHTSATDGSKQSGLRYYNPAAAPKKDLQDEKQLEQRQNISLQIYGVPVLNAVTKRQQIPPEKFGSYQIQEGVAPRHSQMERVPKSSQVYLHRLIGQYCGEAHRSPTHTL